jgi:tetratricopeptide (TPR) repeat protein
VNEGIRWFDCQFARISTRKLRAIASLALGMSLALVAGCSHKTADDYLKDGDAARQNSQLAQAEVDYQAAIKTAPNDARGYLALGQLYASEKKPEQAQPEFIKALELAPKDPATHAAIGGAYADQMQLGLAEDQYRAAVALEPASAQYRMMLGRVLQSGQKLGAAEVEYRTAIGLEPKNAKAHLALADLLNGEPNRQQEAQSEYAIARALDSGLASAAAATSPSPPAAPTPMAAASVAPPPQLIPFKHLFLLTQNSAVYESANPSARTLAQVHRGKKVHVTAITADKKWLRVRLKTGVVGFVPATATE